MWLHGLEDKWSKGRRGEERMGEDGGGEAEETVTLPWVRDDATLSEIELRQKPAWLHSQRDDLWVSRQGYKWISMLLCV